MASLLGDGVSAKAVESLLGDGVSEVKKGKVLVFDTETTGLPLTSFKENNAFQSGKLLSRDVWGNLDMGSILVEKGKPGEKISTRRQLCFRLLKDGLTSFSLVAFYMIWIHMNTRCIINMSSIYRRMQTPL